MSFAEQVFQRIAPLQLNPWAGWKKGTEVTRRFLDRSKPGGETIAHLQPDLIYRVEQRDELLSRFQLLKGKQTRQDFPIGREGGLPKAGIHPNEKGVATSQELDGAKVRMVRHELEICRHGTGRCLTTRQWVLEGHPQVLIRQEWEGQWWAITSVKASKKIGSREYQCVVARSRSSSPDGYSIKTQHLHPLVPGHLVEEIVEHFRPATEGAILEPWTVSHELAAKVTIPE